MPGPHSGGVLPPDRAPARLTVDHGPGLWVAWLDASATEGPAAAARSLWGQTPAPAETRAPPLPAEMALNGASQRIQAEKQLAATQAGQITRL